MPWPTTVTNIEHDPATGFPTVHSEGISEPMLSKIISLYKQLIDETGDSASEIAIILDSNYATHIINRIPADEADTLFSQLAQRLGSRRWDIRLGLGSARRSK